MHNTNHKSIRVLLVFLFLNPATGEVLAQAEAQHANPATEYCVLAGGTVTTETDAAGGKRGICSLPDGGECDEWAMFHGTCGPGGPIEDPFAFCNTVRDSDIIPEFRTGGTFPRQLGRMMVERGLVSNKLPVEMWNASRWRCMNGEVWICPLGANLPCAEKADLSTDPAEAMTNFCRTKPDAATIPAYVTGRATVYAWKCRDSLPVAGRQVTTPDEQGFISEIWHRLEKPMALDSAPLSDPQARRMED